MFVVGFLTIDVITGKKNFALGPLKRRATIARGRYFEGLLKCTPKISQKSPIQSWLQKQTNIFVLDCLKIMTKKFRRYFLPHTVHFVQQFRLKQAYD